MHDNTLFSTLISCFCLSAATVVFAVAQNSNYTYLGCFLGRSLLSLGNDNHVLTPTSPRSCSKLCAEKQHAFFVLKNDTCYCNKNYISGLMKEFDGDCTTKCTGDESASCGGPPDLVSSYATDVSESIKAIGNGSYPIPIYLGCYTETPNDDENRLLKGPAQPYSNNTPQTCSEICFNMGYLYFGVTYGSECWCGNQQPSKSSKVDDINCDTPCSGNPAQLCGGGWKIGIYSTGITDHVPTKYVGCFEDEGNITRGTYLSYQMGNNNSPRRCMNLCNTQQFNYAAIRGNVCECMNNGPGFSSARSFSDCNIVCKESPYEYCGGSGSKLQNIYKTTRSDTLGKVSVDHVGCFKNFKAYPILNGWRLTISHLTSKRCVYSCFARMFPYAALISSKECLCSFIKPHNEALIKDEMCTTPCSGSSEKACGDHKTIHLYSTGYEPKRVATGNYYLGCFEERPQNRLFNSYSKSFSTNTPEFCSNLCYTFGYTYSGVTYKSECFCGSRSPVERHFTKVDDKNCNTKCTGDANQYCGGGWRIGVFATGLYDFQIDNQYIGCFVLQDNSLNNKKFEFIYTNTPNKCSATCNGYGYQYANVIGINCLCSDEVPNDDQKVHDADCDTTCVGNSNETCGGDDRIQIYNLKIPSSMVNNSELAHHTSEQLESNTTVSIDLNEEFDSLNLKSLWSYDIYIAQEPDFEFVIYNNSGHNSFVKNGELVIKPTIQSDDNFVRKGSLIMNGCTKNTTSFQCAMNASSFQIIPPIMSAKLTTKNKLLFRHGQLEVIAKFPIGDWIVSEIALISESNEQNKLILASSFGNNDLKCNGEDESTTILRYGLKIDEKLYNAKSKMMKSALASRWSNDYHSFGLSWNPDNIEFKIDGESNLLNASNIPPNFKFDSKYYIAVGVSVGGMMNFRDDCLSNNSSKPWKNFDNKASLNFWKDKTNWSSTWNDETSTLRVKSVRLVTKEKIK